MQIRPPLTLLLRNGELLEALEKSLSSYQLITAFALIGGIVWLGYFISDRITRGRVHGSAIAIVLGLVLAYAGGALTHGNKGLADIPMFAGVGLLGGTMLRDFAIVSTAFGINVGELRRAGTIGVVSLFAGIFASFFTGAIIAYAAGYRDAVSMTTLGGGAATYIVGPVTGAALGAKQEVITLSFAAGLIKAIAVMVATPLVARWIGLDNPRTAIVFGGLMGTTSGVAGGLAATDPRLVPYGAMTATFYTGLGCILGPSLIYAIIRLMQLND